MSYPALDYITPEAYLEIEARAEQKHEYFEGRIFDMVGASLKHNIIVSNIMSKISIFLDGKPGDLYGSDLRIATPVFDSIMYPDFSIICEAFEIKEKSPDTVTNPSVIIEVMSPSTRGYDMAFKFHYYKQIPSLKEYILIDSTRLFVQNNLKNNDNSWQSKDILDINEKLPINTINLQLSLNDIYRKVTF